MSSLTESQATLNLLTQRLESRSHIRRKQALRAFTILLALVGLGLHIGVLFQHPRRYNGSSVYSYSSYLWVSPEGYTFLGISLIWNIAELITFCVNKRGIHPGAHVALDLNLWMGFLAAGIVQLIIDSWNPVAAAAGSVKMILAYAHSSLSFLLPHLLIPPECPPFS